MKRYKISKENLNEFWGLFGRKKPQTMQQIIDDDPVLKKLDKELEDIATSYIPRLKQMKKQDPELFKMMQDRGIIGKDW
jgi:hypothetical protein